eukprot:1902647-Heterocapsa_arctica.AAC.1
MEKWVLVREARDKNENIHLACVFPICSEKGNDLLKGDPDRKFKGRCVLQGDNVRDENHQTAIFQELSSQPATLEAAKSVDAYGMLPGHNFEQCDAQQAYVQCKLGGTPTWVTLPKLLQPKDWASKYTNPVVRLKLALYGQPDAGGYWEEHCNKHLAKVGFEPVPDWRSTFWHPKLKFLLMVYVDDFKDVRSNGEHLQRMGTYSPRYNDGRSQACIQVPGLRTYHP